LAAHRRMGSPRGRHHRDWRSGCLGRDGAVRRLRSDPRPQGLSRCESTEFEAP
jgi:hypothetical protein